MSLTHSELRRLNRIFGEEFGFNPHGQPNFRWMRSEEMFWFVDHGSAWNRDDSGLITYSRKHDRRCWTERIGRCWLLAKWVFTPEEEWVRQHGDRIPWSKQGEWNPIENWKLDHNQDPTIDLTNEVCEAIRFHRRHSYQDWLDEYDAEWAAYQKGKQSELDSLVSDAMTVNFHRLVDPFGASLSPIGKKKPASENKIVLATS